MHRKRNPDSRSADRFSELFPETGIFFLKKCIFLTINHIRCAFYGQIPQEFSGRLRGNIRE